MTKMPEGIVDLWPTKLLRRHLENYQEPNRQLLKLIREMEKSNRELTTDYRDNNLLNLDHPGTNWLRFEVNQSVIQYLKSIEIRYSVDWQIHAWANINRMGDYHDLHNHPHCYLSGTYYLKMPGNAEYGRRRDLRPNRISFYDPRPNVNMGSIKNDPYVDPEFTILPEPGLLLLWPAFLNHFVHPNLSKETRVSVSFNIILKWADHYIPDQH
tara:strand:+ start:161 stop:796 length:636 start_codon:yes stop_codon:yes gene_type:complete